MEPSRASTFDVQRELRRIGVDLDRLRGLAASGGTSPIDFRAWLRTIPGGIGHDAFMRRLQAPPDQGGPHTPREDEPPAPDVATYVDSEIDELQALRRELDRVVPPSTWADGSTALGVDWSQGRAHALRVLRSLPDRAGPEALSLALSPTPPLTPPTPGRVPDPRGAARASPRSVPYRRSPVLMAAYCTLAVALALLLGGGGLYRIVGTAGAAVLLALGEIFVRSRRGPPSA